jgi:hypothetical protein
LLVGRQAAAGVTFSTHQSPRRIDNCSFAAKIGCNYEL